MTIAKFCRQNKLPQRRVHRLIKKEVEMYEPVPIEDEWLADLSADIGVTATKKDESSRTYYSVVNPTLLLQWIHAEIGTDMLCEEDIAIIIGAARFAHDIATGSHDKYAVFTADGKDPFTASHEYFDALDNALKKAGK